MNFDYKNDVQPLIVKYDPIKKSTFNLKNIVASKAGLNKKSEGVLQLSDSKQKNTSLFNVANFRTRFATDEVTMPPIKSFLKKQKRIHPLMWFKINRI